MKKETIVALLTDIEEQGILGVNRSDDGFIDTVYYALERGLLQRTHHGNFELTEKGRAVLYRNTKPWNLSGYDMPKVLIEQNHSEENKMIAAEQGDLKKVIIIAVTVLMVALVGIMIITNRLS